MARIEFERRDSWFGRIRKYRIFIDEKFYHEIGNNQAKIVEIPAGAHTIQFKVDWIRSRPIEIEVNDTEHVKVLVSFNERLKWLFPPAVWILGAFLMIFGPFFQGLSWLYLLLVPSALVTIYLISIGSKHYFSIRLFKGTNELKLY